MGGAGGAGGAGGVPLTRTPPHSGPCQESSGATGEAARQLLADAEEAASFLRTYVVQARLNERGNYRMTVQPHHADTVAEEAALRGPRPGGGVGGEAG